MQKEILSLTIDFEAAKNGVRKEKNQFPRNSKKTLHIFHPDYQQNHKTSQEQIHFKGKITQMAHHLRLEIV